MSASTNPLWAWNVRHSPIAKRLRTHRYVQPLLSASGLSQPVVRQRSVDQNGRGVGFVLQCGGKVIPRLLEVA